MTATVSPSFSSKDEIHLAYSRLKNLTQQTPFPTIEERQQCLQRLQAALLVNEEPLLDALLADFGHRAPQESTIA